ncbi:MAG TPA: ABC transporter ATP-binding protein, partial [Clostridia bacterium]|nr:ABC transporter ATP-binding protein [Clostridia bacterium]
RKALKENMKNSALIIVAQRIGTIIDADNIIVLDEGKIAGMGKHKDLLKSCAVYREIALSQLSEEDLA